MIIAPLCSPGESFRSVTRLQLINKKKGVAAISGTSQALDIQSDTHLLELIRYIHNNPVHHSLTTKPEQWQYSSYRAMLYNTPTRVERTKALQLFGDVNTFVQFHQQSNSRHNIEYCVISIIKKTRRYNGI